MNLKKFIHSKLKTCSVDPLMHDKEFDGERPSNAHELGIIDKFTDAITNLLKSKPMSNHLANELVSKHYLDIDRWYHEGKSPSNIADELRDEAVTLGLYSTKINVNCTCDSWDDYFKMAEFGSEERSMEGFIEAQKLISGPFKVITNTWKPAPNGTRNAKPYVALNKAFELFDKENAIKFVEVKSGSNGDGQSYRILQDKDSKSIRVEIWYNKDVLSNVVYFVPVGSKLDTYSSVPSNKLKELKVKLVEAYIPIYMESPADLDGLESILSGINDSNAEALKYDTEVELNNYTENDPDPKVRNAVKVCKEVRDELIKLGVK